MTDVARAALVISLDEQRKLRGQLKAVASGLQDHRDQSEQSVKALVVSIEHAREHAEQQLQAGLSSVHERLTGVTNDLQDLAGAVEGLPETFGARLSSLGDDLRRALAESDAQRAKDVTVARAEAATALSEAVTSLADELEAVQRWIEVTGGELADQDHAISAALDSLHTELASVRQQIPAPVSKQDIEAAARAAVEDMAPQFVGAPGQPGLVWRGKWERLTTYAKGDVVQHRGSSWVALAEVIGQEPGHSSAWDLLAKAGTDGGGGGRALSSQVDPGVVYQGLLQGFEQTILPSVHGLPFVTSVLVLNPQGVEVSIVARIVQNSVTVTSNVELTNHQIILR